MYFCSCNEKQKRFSMYKGYFKFLKQSSNQHGVHSPFVFNLLVKGLYSKEKKWRRRKNRGKKKNFFLIKLITYFKPNSVCVPVNRVEFYQNDVSNVTKRFAGIDSVSGSADFFIIDSTVDCLDVDKYIQMMHNDSILVVDRGAMRLQTKEIWQAILEDDRITVSIDFYSFGVAFIRKEQLKEHFILRM